MAKANIQDIRNLVVCGHGGCGKTTLVDQLLTKTGAVNAHPSVDEGTSICDFDPEEKHHKYTIEAKVVHFEHGGKHFQMIDTPGYPDFIGQTIGAMHGVDTAVIVINAQAGIEVNTRRVFAEAGKAGLGRMIVINKMDAENIDFPALVDAIREMWGSACVLLNVPRGTRGRISRAWSARSTCPGHQRRAARSPRNPRSAPRVDHRSRRRGDGAVLRGHAADRRGTVRPDRAGGRRRHAWCRSSAARARRAWACPELLDAVATCGLPPDAQPRTVTKGDEQMQVKADPDGPLVAQVFKTRIDPFVQKLSFIRIYSGTIKRTTTCRSARRASP